MAKKQAQTPATRYQEKLQKQTTKHSLFVVLIAFVSFIATFTLYISGFNLYRAHENNRWLSESFSALQRGYTDFIMGDAVRELLVQYLDGELSDNAVAQQFHGFERNMPVGADIVLSDIRGGYVYTTLNSEEAQHLIIFDSIMHARMRRQHTEAVYNTVYYLKGTSARYVFARNVYAADGTYIGNVSIYIDGDEWNSQLRARQVDGIITDLAGNVVASSSRSLVDGLNRFTPGTTMSFTRDGLQYWMRQMTNDSYGVRFYSLVYDSTITQYLALGLLAFCIIAVIVMLLARRLARNIADINAASIGTLMTEIDKVRHQGGDSHIHMESDDEFTTIAAHINDMVDSINALGRRNLALTELNAVMEIKQLEAQFDPHFLYNTLEAIRYAIQIDPASADAVIRKLTKLLRYSISGGDSIMRLEEDMAYLKDYLDIIQFRYAERFSYDIDVAPECAALLVPKLLLQTLCENSIKYGFKDKGELHIAITCETQGDHLVLRVADNGTGIEPGRLREVEDIMRSEQGDGVHIGLHYVARRIALQYGAAGHVDIKSDYGHGTVIEIKIERGALDSGI